MFYDPSVWFFSNRVFLQALVENQSNDNSLHCFGGLGDSSDQQLEERYPIPSAGLFTQILRLEANMWVKNMSHLPFRFWVPSLSIMLSSSIHLLANLIFLCSWIKFHLYHTTFFISVHQLVFIKAVFLP